MSQVLEEITYLKICNERIFNFIISKSISQKWSHATLGPLVHEVLNFIQFSVLRVIKLPYICRLIRAKISKETNLTRFHFHKVYRFFLLPPSSNQIVTIDLNLSSRSKSTARECFVLLVYKNNNKKILSPLVIGTTIR